MIDEVDGDRADWAQTAVVEWRLRIALDFDQNTIAHMEQRATSAMARAANTLEDDCGLAGSGIFRVILLERHRSCLATGAPEWRRVRESLPSVRSLSYAESEISDRFIPLAR